MTRNFLRTQVQCVGLIRIKGPFNVAQHFFSVSHEAQEQRRDSF